MRWQMMVAGAVLLAACSKENAEDAADPGFDLKALASRATGPS